MSHNQDTPNQRIDTQGFVVGTERVLTFFNELVKIITKSRDIDESTELEMKVKSSYTGIRGRNNGALNGQSPNNSNESDNDDLEVYNRFEGESSLSTSLL